MLSLQFSGRRILSQGAPPTSPPCFTLSAATTLLEAPPNVRALRTRAAVIYAVGCALSVFWAVSADLFMDNALGATAQVAATDDGTTYLTVRNDADFPWSQVRLEVDGRYFYRLPSVPAGGQIDARVSDFINAYTLPRPTGLFYWERVAERPDPERAPVHHMPRRLVIEAEQATIELVLAP